MRSLLLSTILCVNTHLLSCLLSTLQIGYDILDIPLPYLKYGKYDSEFTVAFLNASKFTLRFLTRRQAHSCILFPNCTGNHAIT